VARSRQTMWQQTGPDPQVYGERAVGGIFAGLIEPPEPVGEDRLERVDAGLPDLDQTLAQLLAIGLADPVRHRVDAIPKLRDNGLQRGL